MKRFFSILTVFVLVFSLFTCATQTSTHNEPPSLSKQGLNFNFKQGTIVDQQKYDSVEEARPHNTRAGLGGPLPPAASLKEFAPIPGNQGGIGSCFAWASAYSARTIIESQYLGRTDKVLSTKMAFSPLYLYIAVREVHNYSSSSDGASLVDTMSTMVGVGMPRRITFDDSIVANIVEGQEERQYVNPIMGFGILFTSNANPSYRVDRVKRNLVDGDPVIIAVMVPDSFVDAKDSWAPADDEIVNQDIGHALCVVGYDDNKYGGSFEIMNSWGEEWGNGGYTWVSYDTFGKWVEQAWVITEDVSIYEDAFEFTGKVNVELTGKNEAAQVRLLEDGVYRLPSTVKNGSQIRLQIENTGHEDLYKYTFYFNPENGKAVKINGNEWVSPGNSVKQADFVVLYSRTELDIDSILSSVEKQKGNIPSRLGNIMGKDFVQFGNSKYELTSMQMTSDFISKKSVAGMVLSVKYDAEEKPISDMVPVKGGRFMMGSPSSEKGRYDDEKQYRETVGDFYIGAAEVTVHDFMNFVNATGYKTSAEKSGASMFVDYMNDQFDEREGLNWQNPGFTQEGTHPVVHVNWLDAVEYCNWRSSTEGLTPVYTISGNSVTSNTKANGYRLPTEAEWEYACRAGTTTPYNTGKTISANQANYADAMLYKTTPVRKYEPNQWGIYDMHGNVFEWCSDLEDGVAYIRGGTWFFPAENIRSAYRGGLQAHAPTIFTGFRLAKNGD